jgi:hypothetical protein
MHKPILLLFFTCLTSCVHSQLFRDFNSSSQQIYEIDDVEVEQNTQLRRIKIKSWDKILLDTVYRKSESDTSVHLVDKTFRDIYVFKNYDTIVEAANISRCTFQSHAIFMVRLFKNGLQSHESNYLGKTFYFLTDFKRPVFVGSNYDDDVNYEYCRFYELYMDNCRFKSKVYFKDAEFYGLNEFHTVQFGKFVSFTKINITDSTTFAFIDCVLADTIDFSYNPNIRNEIDFSPCNFKDSAYFDFKRQEYRRNKRHLINLYKSDISKFHLDYHHFRLLLKDAATGNDLPRDEAISVYEGLLKNFKDRGQMDSYELLDIEYQQFRDQSFLKLSSRFNKWWWNFGYDRGKIFNHTIIILMLLSIINFFFLHKLNKSTGVYYIQQIPTDRPLRNISLSSAIKRLWYSFAYTATIFFLFSLKIESINFKKIAVIYIIAIHALGLICLAYIAAYVLHK